MISVVLQQLEKLRAELELIDPAGDLQASGTVADIGVALQKLVADRTPDEKADAPRRRPRIAA